MSEEQSLQARIIAIPSLAPGGLSAERSGHFGHCDSFTLAKVDERAITDVRVVDNSPHHEGGCLDPVRLLASLGTTEMIVGGMGARPLAFFGEMGIAVYADQELPTVGEVLEAHLRGDVPLMSAMHVCGGGSCHR